MLISYASQLLRHLIFGDNLEENEVNDFGVYNHLW